MFHIRFDLNKPLREAGSAVNVKVSTEAEVLAYLDLVKPLLIGERWVGVFHDVSGQWLLELDASGTLLQRDGTGLAEQKVVKGPPTADMLKEALAKVGLSD